MISANDLNSDNQIQFNEFLKLMENAKQKEEKEEKEGEITSPIDNEGEQHLTRDVRKKKKKE